MPIRSVAVVSTDPRWIERLRDLLAKQVEELRVFTTAESALATLAQEGPVDALVVDAALPSRSRDDLLLRAGGPHLSTTVVVLESIPVGSGVGDGSASAETDALEALLRSS